MSTTSIRLSVLDQSPVRKGVTATQAVQETIALAQYTEKLGYYRFWVAEHHNTTSLAGSTPEVLLAHLAAQTQHMRLGSGGVMMPNHSTLKVAENFKMLEALAPGRIDLGMGRAPGTDRLTASVLNPSNQFKEQDFIEQLADLQDYFHDASTPGTIQERVKAIPKINTVPEMWLLSSSGQSGLFAAHFGMGLAFAHFINPAGGAQAVELYRNRFKPSADMPQPQASVAVFAFCSEDEEQIRRHEALMLHRFLQLERGGGLEPLNYEDIEHEEYTAAERERMEYNRRRMVTGTSAQIKEKLSRLAETYQVNELILITITETFEERLQSYQLIADQFLHVN